MSTAGQRMVALITATALLVTGCSRPPEQARQAAGDRPRSAIVARIDTLRAMDIRKAAESTAGLSYEVERPLLAFAGFDSHLGGEQATDAALAGLMRAYKAKIVPAAQAVPRFMKASYESHIADGLGAIGSSFMTSALMLSALGDADQSGSQTQSTGGVKLDLAIEGDRASVATGMDAVSGRFSGKTRAKAVADLCPDPSGRVHISFTVDSSATDGAGSGANTRVSVEVNRYFDDDAKVKRELDFDGNVQQSAFEGGKGGYVDLSLKADMASGSVKINSRNAAATDAHVQAVQSYITTTAGLAALMLDMAAKRRVESGRCIDLKVETDPVKRSHAAPSTQYAITAMPRAKADGAMAPGTVSATLSGSGKLAEAGARKRADAQFRYTGPDKVSQTGHVLLESRSRRGVGKATVDFDTWLDAWRATMGGAYWPNGVICDRTRPFVFEGDGTTLTFTPRDADGGSFTLNSRYSFGRFTGGGEYHIVIDAGGRSGTLTAKGRMTMSVTGAGSRQAPLNAAYPLEATASSSNCNG